MGQPKLLLSWGQTSVLGHLIKQWEALGVGQIAVVFAEEDLAIGKELDRLCFPRESRIGNPQPDRGMFSSIVCAAQWPKWDESLTHWIIVLGDQPHLRGDTLSKLLEFAKNHPEEVCQPTRAGKRRHPVVLPKVVFVELARAGCADLKEFLANYQVASCECADPGLELDIDRPEDYQRALALAGLTTQ